VNSSGEELLILIGIADNVAIYILRLLVMSRIGSSVRNKYWERILRSNEVNQSCSLSDIYLVISANLNLRCEQTCHVLRF